MARQRRNTRPLDDLPTLFDGLEIDFTRPEISGGLPVRELMKEDLSPLALVDDGLRVAMPKASPTQKLMFMSFGSGSSGNCAYLGNGKEGILIDAGVDPVKVKTQMNANGLDFKGVKGILLTHDHSDHVRFAYTFLRKQHQMMLYTTPKALNGMLRRHSISSRIKDYHKPIYKEHPFDIGNFHITAFDNSHDGTDNMGFHISFGDYHSFVVLTDSGCITERADYYIRRARYLMIESNYDPRMLADGPYTEFLKARISSDTGHLGNDQASEYVASIIRPELTHLFLCHLSADNNTPELALRTMKSALEKAEVTVGDGSNSIEANKAMVQLVALPRFDSSALYLFREP